MFLDYFHLREDPFGVTPDPRFLFLGEMHREALASIIYGIETGRGFIGLIGAAGLGKTTLLYQVLEHFQHSARTALLFNTPRDSRDFMQSLIGDLAPEIPRTADLLEMNETFNELLLKEASRGRRVIVAIDEAQNLQEEVLESVRMLSNFETAESKLLQIILAGQERLATKLRSPKMVQLRQRLSMVVKLQRLEREDANQYIDHRLSVAGYAGQDPFTAGARELLIEASGGTPRVINTLCFNAFSLACAVQAKQIDDAIVREIVDDLELDEPESEIPEPAPTEMRAEKPSSNVLEEPRRHVVQMPMPETEVELGQRYGSQTNQVAATGSAAARTASTYDRFVGTGTRGVEEARVHTVKQPRPVAIPERPTALGSIAQETSPWPQPVDQNATRIQTKRVAPIPMPMRQTVANYPQPSGAAYKIAVFGAIVVVAAVLGVAAGTRFLRSPSLLPPQQQTATAPADATANTSSPQSSAAPAPDPPTSTSDVRPSRPATAKRNVQKATQASSKASDEQPETTFIRFDRGAPAASTNRAQTTVISQPLTGTETAGGNSTGAGASSNPPSPKNPSTSIPARDPGPPANPSPNSAASPANTAPTPTSGPTFSSTTNSTDGPRSQVQQAASNTPSPAAFPDMTASAAVKPTVVEPARVIENPPPKYPALARSAGISGKVVLEGIVGTDGRVHTVKVVSGSPMLASAAIEAVEKWLYRPSMTDGRSQESPIRLVFDFQ